MLLVNQRLHYSFSTNFYFTIIFFHLNSIRFTKKKSFSNSCAFFFLCQPLLPVVALFLFIKTFLFLIATFSFLLSDLQFFYPIYKNSVGHFNYDTAVSVRHTYVLLTLRLICSSLHNTSPPTLRRCVYLLLVIPER